MVDVSERIKYAMSIRDMRLIDLADKSGINKGTISYYLSKKFRPKQDAIIKLAEALMVRPDWLIGCNVPMETAPIDIKGKFYKLDEVDRAKVDAFIDGLLASEKYNKKEGVG